MKKREKYAVGVDIGGTNIKIGIISGSGEIVSKSAVKTLGEGGPAKVVSQLKKGITDILGSNDYKISGIGIGCAGTVRQETGLVENPPNLPGWKKVRLGEIIREEFGYKVILDNDANAAALGEMLFGAGMNLKSFIMITLGTGVGGGIIIDRQIYHGQTGAAGEIGHSVIDFNGPKCNCGSYGCLEAYIGNHYLVRRVGEEMKNKTGTKLWELVEGDVGNLSARLIDKAARQGDEFARSIVEQTGGYLGYSLASLANIFDICTFIIGGGVAGFGRPMLSAARRNAAERVLTPMKKRIKVLPARLKNDAGIMGASALVFSGK